MFKEISHPVLYGDLVYKLRRVKDTQKFISSGSKIVKLLRRRQYDPLNIERTIGLVFGLCTALYRIFLLKHCTLTNKAVGTTWRALSKSPQRRQGPDLRPLWYKSGLLQPSDLSSLSAGRSKACPIRMSLYIFLLYYIYHLCFTRIEFCDLSACSGCLFVVYIRRLINQFLKVCPFDYTAVAESGKVGSVNQVNHTSLVTVVTATDRPKSVRNRCVIELFVALFVLSLCPFDISAGVGAFVIRLSQISSVFSYRRKNTFS